MLSAAISESETREENIRTNKKYDSRYGSHFCNSCKCSAFRKIAKHITKNKYHTGNE
jgi:hypothetical protein